MRLNLDTREWYDSAPRTIPAASTKPPTSIWDLGALVCSGVGERVYGRVAGFDPHVDYVLVHVYDFSGPLPVMSAWGGKRSEFQKQWSFAHHAGAA